MYSALSSCVIEEEKWVDLLGVDYRIAQQLMQELQSEIVQQVRIATRILLSRGRGTTVRSSAREFHAAFLCCALSMGWLMCSESISDVKSIVENSIVWFCEWHHGAGDWSHRLRLDSREGDSCGSHTISYSHVHNCLHCTFVVIDVDDVGKSNPQEYRLSPQQIIGFAGFNPVVQRTTKDYVLPAGKRVLCLWPNSTTFYPATVVPRGDVSVSVRVWRHIQPELIAVQFDDVDYYYLLPYSHVVPFKKWSCLLVIRCIVRVLVWRNGSWSQGDGVSP